MNTDRSLDNTEDQAITAPPDEETTLSDLLHVLGLKKKKRGAKKLHPASRSRAIPVPTEAINVQDSLIPAKPVNSESVNETKSGIVVVDASSEAFVEGNYTNTADFMPDMSAPMRNKPKARKLAMIAPALLIIVVVVYFALPNLIGPIPPGEDVVASFNGRNILIEELKSFIALEKAKEEEHILCDTHGYDHEKCTSDEECESHPIHSLEGYRQMVTNLAIEQIIQEWASVQGVTQREDVQHGIKDLLDNASVSQLMERLHEEEITPESISNWDVQQYYNNNRESYNGKTLAEVEDEIRQIMVTEKDKDFFEQYIEKLKQTAGLIVNFDILKVNTPSDNEISIYYNQNVSQYQVPPKAEYLEIRIVTGDTQNTAAEAIRKIRSGESFDSVASKYSQGGNASALTIENGSGEATIETVLWKMQPGDISDPITNTDGSASIIKLISATKSGARPLSEVKSDIQSMLQQKNMESEYTLRADEALFSVHSRRYTLGEFYTEFKELSPAYQVKFSTFEQKQKLMEQLIAKELLLEATGDLSSDERKQHSYDELKIQYLSQILHQQEVDKKLSEPSEDEMQKFYNKNKKSFVSPATVQISLIWIDQGINGEKTELARQKADEALSLLRGGTDFAEVAKKYSEDGSAASGGEVAGILDRNHLQSQLGKVIFALKAGETSEIIDFDYGFYIIKVRELSPIRHNSCRRPLQDLS